MYFVIVSCVPHNVKFWLTGVISLVFTLQLSIVKCSKKSEELIQSSRNLRLANGLTLENPKGKIPEVKE